MSHPARWCEGCSPDNCSGCLADEALEEGSCSPPPSLLPDPDDRPIRKPSEVVPGRLRELRRSRGWSQRHLAELLQGFGLNVRRPAIPLMEREPSDERPNRKASLDEVVALASIFGVPLEYLYDDCYDAKRSWIVRQSLDSWPTSGPGWPD